MPLKSAILACAALLAVVVPTAALADPWDHDGWREHEWRENAWRRHEWREHDAWEHRGGWGGYGGPRCTIEDRGHYDWYGNFIHEPVRICWR